MEGLVFFYCDLIDTLLQHSNATLASIKAKVNQSDLKNIWRIFEE